MNTITELLEQIRRREGPPAPAPPPRPCDSAAAHHTWIVADFHAIDSLTRCLCGARLYRDTKDRRGHIVDGAPFLHSFQVRRAEH